VRSVPGAITVLTVRPAAMIGTGHTPPDQGARTTALSDRETRPIHPRRAGQVSPGRTDRTVRDGQHARTSRSPCHTVLVPRVDQPVPRGQHQTVRQHRHARRHRVQDEHVFIQACKLTVSARQQASSGHGYERTSEHRQRRRPTPPVPLTLIQDTPRTADTADSSAGVDSQGCRLYPQQPVRVRLLLPVEHTNRARHPRGSPGVPLNAAKVGLKFAHEPKEIDVEPRILGTRLRITRAYRSYGARVPSW
jgi:hypothetical protein